MPAKLDMLRAELQSALPDRIRAALAAYHRFTADDPPDDPKSFAAWHAAAKAALAHVEGLVKLMRWAQAEADAAGGEENSDALLEQARGALARLDDGDG